MTDIRTLIDLLGYRDSPYFRTKESEFEPESVHYFRLAKERLGEKFAVKGFYVFNSTQTKGGEQVAKPVVCIAEAPTIEDARKLHRRIWNIGKIPFLLVRLPNQVLVYCGFRYDDDQPILNEASNDEASLQIALQDFTAASIDSARIWQAQRERLDTQYRVDRRLLANLKELAQALAKYCSPQLDLTTAHALIGKYVYLRYLRDRDILSDEWLASFKQPIDLDKIFGAEATTDELSRLVNALEDRFNGDVFHIDFAGDGRLNDSHVKLVSSVFAGDSIHTHTTGYIQQLHLKFQAYDFRHIPVEMLSSIYEQFLHAQEDGRSEGAYYTPELLADYLLSEINSIRQIQPSARILDASAGSGIFLVLAYRRLIELERRTNKDVDPMRLREILLESIYGVERQRDACNVTVFSLILTLLNYVTPPALHANKKFRFPILLNNRIFCDDFFNPQLSLAVPRGGFDFIVGNPPWTELKPSAKEKEKYALKWLSTERKVAGNRIGDAFAVKVGRLLSKDGVAGLVLSATTLFNLEAKRFRQSFFSEFSVSRITNLANLRDNLFGGRIKQPATTIIFQKRKEGHCPPILHVAPFAVNQVTGDTSQLWALSIQGSDMQWVSQADAAKGETSVWKLALWGTARDARAIDCMQQMYPLTLENFCKERGWGRRLPRQGAELRDYDDKEDVIFTKELIGQKRFDTKEFNRLIHGGLHFSIPKAALIPIADSECYIRTRGGKAGLEVNQPPHLMLSATWKNFIAFSEDYFAVPPRQMAISAPEEDKEQLRSLAVYLGASLVDYYLFFQVPEWGVYSDFPHVALKAVRSIPTPDFTPLQVKALAEVHHNIIRAENDFQLHSSEESSKTTKQILIDESVFRILNIPEHLRLLVEDFRDTRLPLDKGRPALRKLGQRPSTKELDVYRRTLQTELERFLLGEALVSVELIVASDLICCKVNFHSKGRKSVASVNSPTNQVQSENLLRLLKKRLGERFSQWVYVDRNLRVYVENVVEMYKAPRLMDWTRTQALNDADCIIADVIEGSKPPL